MKHMIAAVCVLAVAGMAGAEDKPNPSGTWKYTAEVNGQSFDVTIKLKLEGDKLTGTVSVLDMESKIEDGKNKGDTFKGKRELEIDGQQTNTRDFEAKRSKE